MSTHTDELHSLISAYLDAQCAVMLDAEGLLRAREDVIHPTRVAVRRLRSTLRVFAEVFDIARAGQLEDELVWWAGLLGGVRDLDILGARLDAAVGALAPELVLGPVRAHLQTEVGVRRHAAMDVVVETLDSGRYRELVAMLQQWRSDTPYVGGADTGPAKVGFYVKRAGQLVRQRLAAAVTAERAGEVGAGPLLHRARKSAKRHRYALELAEPVLGEKATRAIAARRALQDVLGDAAGRTADRPVHLGPRAGGQRPPRRGLRADRWLRPERLPPTGTAPTGGRLRPRLAAGASAGPGARPRLSVQPGASDGVMSPGRAPRTPNVGASRHNLD